ncbi:dsDNA nuclease domain-containing protein [Acinetobacter guillouiae]|uniref:dsDNA nuclease domain-containing protein n=1 Tax=Acinetobacter guillouiae TaxID=106649 RepID=UPI001CD4139A|nr:dsDNA nuclease domain-containing protein [Acinetobacter guillouiae]
MNKNSLDVEQRETIGIDTQLRFNYQTDWAIVYLLEKVINNEEFVIFMEYHEDVICSNSIHLHKNIEFEFYQLKTTQSNFTLANICKYELDSNSNSVLGKMILSIENKIFKKNVKKLCLLSTSDINFSKKIKNLGDYKYLKDLNNNEINEIFNLLALEIDEIDLGYKDIICFQKANLPFQNSESTAKGKISEFIDKKYGTIKSNISSIYRALWDDLRIKHDYLLPFEKWDECVEKRGLKSEEVASILAKNIEIELNINLKNFIENYIKNIENDVMFSPIKINNINKYHIHLLTNRSPSFIKEINELRAKIKLPSDIYDTEQYSILIDHINDEIKKFSILRGFNQMKVVSIYEVLNKIYEELTK